MPSSFSYKRAVVPLKTHMDILPFFFSEQLFLNLTAFMDSVVFYGQRCF